MAPGEKRREKETPQELATLPTQRATAIRPSKKDRSPVKKWRRGETAGAQEDETGILRNKGDPDRRPEDITAEQQQGRPAPGETQPG